MDYQAAEQYCQEKPATEQCYPFGPEVSVFKVKNKMFALLSRAGESGKELGKQYAGCAFINLKCDPSESAMLCDIFTEVLPGYHMSKKHWVSVVLVPEMPTKEIERLIDRSYALIVKGLKKADRLHLELNYPAEQLYR